MENAGCIRFSFSYGPATRVGPSYTSPSEPNSDESVRESSCLERCINLRVETR